MSNISINKNEKLLQGFNITCEAVAKSLGSEGKLAVLESEMIGTPNVTKDGVSIARNIFFKNKQKSMGSFLAKQCAAATVVKCADATTTSLVLAKGIVDSCKDIDFNKKVEKGIEIAYTEIQEGIKAFSKNVGIKDLTKIVTVSANGNKELGNLVMSAHKCVGKNGIIDVQQHDSPNTFLRDSRGFTIDKGWASPFLINNQKSGVFEAENVSVVVYEGYVEANEGLQNYLNSIPRDTPVLIIAENFSDDFLLRIADFNKNRVLSITAVTCPEFDNKRKALLSDIALLTNAKPYLPEAGEAIVAGTVKKVIVRQDSTSIIQDKSSDEVQQRITELKGQLETTTEKTFIQKRISNLEGVSATIFIGGATQNERKEKFDRAEDAVGAVKSALKSGWIVGGGATLLKIALQMDKKFENTDIQNGYDAMKRAGFSVFEQIVSNSGRTPVNYLEELKAKPYGWGYNATTDEVSNLISDGIIDSAYSISTALENAKSTAILMLNVGVVITF